MLSKKHPNQLKSHFQNLIPNTFLQQYEDFLCTERDIRLNVFPRNVNSLLKTCM